MPRKSRSPRPDRVFRLLGVRKGRYVLAAVLALCLAVVNALSLEPEQSGSILTGRVVKVADGDTVTLIDTHGAKQKIRLLGVDAPELQQAHGQVAKKWLTTQALGKTIQVHVTDTDRYGRKVGKLLTQDPNCKTSECPYNVDLNLELLKLGHAWWYEAYQNNQPPADRPIYEKAHNAARQSRLGLWSNATTQVPWDWRQQQRELKSK